MAISPIPKDTRPVCLITGCSSGIGRALAVDFANSGKWKVVATARRLESLETLPSSIWRVQLDVTSDESVNRAIETIINEHGSIHTLINNAGTNHAVGPSVEVSLKRFQETFDANYFGLIRVTQAVTPHMIKQREGKIINIGSTAGICPLPYSGAYSSSKAAVHALSDVLRAELAPFGIKVIVVAPGAIKSSIGDAGSKDINVADSSPYKSVEDIIRYRAVYSQQVGPTPAHVFAANVRRAVSKRNPAAYLVTGTKSFTAKLAWYLPFWLRDYMIGRLFQLWRIGKPAPKRRA